MSRKLPAMACALTIALATAPRTEAAAPQLPRDGWVSWTVPAPEGAPFWCCWNHWNGPAVSGEACKLDARSHGLGSRGRDETTDAATIYVRTAQGKIDRLQVLAASCPVETATPVQSLTGISADDSVRWLATQAKQDGRDALTHEPLVEQALASLAMHRGEPASRELASFARQDPRAEARKWATFWLAHAGQAGAEETLSQVLRTDQDGEVREHAVFALTLLPDERAVKALIATAEDRSLVREQRKRAVFWLSQSEKDSAQVYLDRILAGARR